MTEIEGQESLFGDERVPDRAYARRSDPETSHAAASSISRRQISLAQADLLRLFSRGDLKLTDAELADLHKVAVIQLRLHHQSPSGLRTRRRELVDLGYLKDSGDRRKLPSGRLAIVWERTDRQEAR